LGQAVGYEAAVTLWWNGFESSSLTTTARKKMLSPLAWFPILEVAGVDVWVDVARVGAADFQERINKALDSCQWLVLVMTSASLASDWVRIEVNAAIHLMIQLMIQRRMRGIIQVIAHGVTKKEIPPTWGIYSHFDATQDYDGALCRTLQALGMSQSSPVPSAAPVQSIPSSLPEAADLLPPRLAELG
jgi:hypothetical protein